MSGTKSYLAILSCLAIVALTAASPVTAQTSAAVAPDQRAEIGSAARAALGLSLFVGPTSGSPYEVVTGYDQGTVYTATGDSVAVADQAIMLRRDGIYRIHLEGVLALDADDATADAGAAALFAIVANDVPWAQCSTPGNTAAPVVAADWRFTPDHEQVSSCKVDFTIEVRGDGSGPGELPLLFPRNTAVQTALIPNDLALGDATLMLTRIEIFKIR